MYFLQDECQTTLVMDTAACSFSISPLLRWALKMTLSAVNGRCFWLGTWCYWIGILMLIGCLKSIKKLLLQAHFTISFCPMLQIHLRLQLPACEKRLRHALQQCNERWCVWVAWTWGCRWNKNWCCICQAAMRRAEAAEVCPGSIWLNWRLTLICMRVNKKLSIVVASWWLVA